MSLNSLKFIIIHAYCESSWIFASIYNCWWNMDLLLDTRIKLTICTVVWTWWKSTKAIKAQKSAGKVLASIFFFGNARGINFVDDYLEKRKTITGDYYCGLLDRFWLMKFEKNDNIWGRKRCYFIMAMHQLSHHSNRWQKYMNCTSNRLLMAYRP